MSELIASKPPVPMPDLPQAVLDHIANIGGRVQALAQELVESGLPAGPIAGAFAGAGIEMMIKGGIPADKVIEIVHTIIASTPTTSTTPAK